MTGLRDARGGARQDRGHLLVALAVASALPIVSLLSPGSVPRAVVVLAVLPWLGIFVVAVRAARRERRRDMLTGSGSRRPSRR